MLKCYCCTGCSRVLRFHFQRKKVVCLFFSFKIYTVKTAITVWAEIFRKNHVQCIYIMYIYCFFSFENWRACYCLKINNFRLIMYLPFSERLITIWRFILKLWCQSCIEILLVHVQHYIKWLLFVCHNKSKLQIQGLCWPLTTRLPTTT